MSYCGFDAGTYNLVACTRNAENNFAYKKEVNAFLSMPYDEHSNFVFNMMKKSGVPLIVREDVKVAYALGEASVNMAYTMPNVELKRPMKDGCVNPKEADAFQIMSIMMHSLLGNLEKDTVLYYTVPANAVNKETDADYHGKILEAIFKAYKSESGAVVKAHPINEALCLVYAELADKNYTGIGISFGAGQVNLCFAIFGAPVFSFSIVNSGDWIDRQSAAATGESIAFINKEKSKIDLTKTPITTVERAIQIQYQLMIDETVSMIKKGLEGNAKARLGQPIDVVIAGGTSSPAGFDVLFKQSLVQANLPMELGNVIRPPDPLFSVARGALIAAENSNF